MYQQEGYASQAALFVQSSFLPSAQYGALLERPFETVRQGVAYAATAQIESSFASPYISHGARLTKHSGLDSFVSSYEEDSSLRSFGTSVYAQNVQYDFVGMYQAQTSQIIFDASESFDSFISPGFESVFVDSMQEIKEAVFLAFSLLMGRDLPTNIIFSLVNTEELGKRGIGRGVMGVSYNRTLFGMSEILVLEGSLASVMLTIGHEIGHVLTPTLADSWLEEAKAYAFQFAWMEIVSSQDILGLSGAFVEYLPAKNGIHDKGYAYVLDKMKQGQLALEIYRDICMSSS